MPHSGVMRLRVAKKAKKRRIAAVKQTKKSHTLKVRGASTLKSHRFLGGYE